MPTPNPNTLTAPGPSKPPTVYSNWSAFIRAKLAPAEIMCQGYFPAHRTDSSCHTRLIPSLPALLSHIDSCGGGFRFTLKQSEKEWPGWKELEAAGIEMQDLRCDICDMVLPLIAQRIMPHLKSHLGKIKKMLPGGAFLMTISPNKPPSAEEEGEVI